MIRIIYWLLLLIITGCSPFKVKKYTNLSEHFAYFVDIAADENSVYISYKDYANFNRLTVQCFQNGKLEYIGKPGFTEKDAYSGKLIMSQGVLWTAFMDCGYSNRLTVMRFIKNQWVTVGSRGISDGYCDNIALAAGNDGRIFVAYTDRARNDQLFIKEFRNGSWEEIAEIKSRFDAISYSVCMIINNNGNPVLLYPDSEKDFAPVITEITPQGVKTRHLSDKKSLSPAFAYNASDNRYEALVTEKDTGNTVLLSLHNDRVSSLILSTESAGNHTLESMPDGNLFIAFGEGESNRLVIGSYNGKRFKRLPEYQLKTPSASFINSAHSGNTVYFAFKDNEQNERASLIVIEE